MNRSVLGIILFLTIMLLITGTIEGLRAFKDFGFYTLSIAIILTFTTLGILAGSLGAGSLAHILTSIGISIGITNIFVSSLSLIPIPFFIWFPFSVIVLMLSLFVSISIIRGSA